MPEQLRSVRSRQAILNAAAELISRQGVAGTSIAQIIGASGTSAGAIYHHYASKNAIVVAVAEQAIAWPLAAFEAYRDNPASPSDLLGFAIGSLIDHPELGHLLVQLGAGAVTDDELGAQLRGVFVQLREAAQTAIGQWARLNGVPADDVRGAGQLLVGLVLGFAAQGSLVSSLDAEAYLAQGRRLLRRESQASIS